MLFLIEYEILHLRLINEKKHILSHLLNENRWKQQLQQRQEEAECTKDTIKILVQNILPAHVGSFPNKFSKCTL